MKWLYRIFRLFKCPHLWVEDKSKHCILTLGGIKYGDEYVFICKRCGKTKIVKSS